MTRVALLWHMHQPFYQDLATGEHILPWVRLHALKDYWGMVALLREFPAMRVTFNLVPSLLVQLDAFARDEAHDRHLAIGLKPADSLSAEERGFCLQHFFHAQRARMIEPYPRYAELLAWRGAEGGAFDAAARASQFSAQDIRDLQVWHKLVWVDAFYQDRDSRVRALVAKGRDFSEADKSILREVELELLGRVIPEYREAAARGQVELSTSPFYHPILPLLCDPAVYLRTHPDAQLPRVRFEHPEDATEQLTRAVALHERLFGERPAGLWPSEGSVSDAMVPLVADAGFSWMATDEEILARTRGRAMTRDASGQVEQPGVLYRPYRVGAPGADVACGFRDHALSDLIGFSYAAWPAEAAADDFVRRVVEAGRRGRAQMAGGEAPTVFVVLDGENAWEHYDGQGRPFLRALYARLTSHAEIETVTMREACGGASERIPSIFPGSWINGDFYIWIGHADDRRAWDQLARARAALDGAPASVTPAALVQAREEILVAEGSDWFWWYGDDHSSEHDMEFDELFRRHVRNVYRALDLAIPDDLLVTNITTAPPDVPIDPPTGFIEPVLDGEVTSYFEWLGAGSASVRGAAGAMHQVAARADIDLIEFGFDLRHLFVRVEADSRPMTDLFRSGGSVNLNFLTPEAVRLAVNVDGQNGGVLVQLSRRDAGDQPACPGAAAALGRVLEIRLPFGCLGVGPGDVVSFLVGLNQGARESAHYPKLRPIVLTVPDSRFVSAHWTA